MSKSAPGVLRGDSHDAMLAVKMTRGSNCKDCNPTDCAGCPAINTIAGIHNLLPVYTPNTPVR